MKISELQSPYKELAEMRRGDSTVNTLLPAFHWRGTIEGYNFWGKVDIGKHPEIPQTSMDELNEWLAKKGRQLNDQVEVITEPPLDLQQTRMKLWCDVVVAVSRSENVRTPETTCGWANKVLDAFDKRFGGVN